MGKLQVTSRTGAAMYAVRDNAGQAVHLLAAERLGEAVHVLAEDGIRPPQSLGTVDERLAVAEHIVQLLAVVHGRVLSVATETAELLYGVAREYAALFDRNRRLYEAKWNVKWSRHRHAPLQLQQLNLEVDRLGEIGFELQGAAERFICIGVMSQQ